MNSKFLLLVIIVTLCVLGLYQLTKAGRHAYPEFQFTEGQIAEYDILAPFDFPVYKTEEQVQEEYAAKLAQVGKSYWMSPDVEFEAYSSLDRLFALIYEAADSSDPGAVALSARQQGFLLDNPVLMLTGDKQRISSSHARIKAALEDLYKAGIYSGISGDSIRVETESGTQQRSLARYFELAEAKRLILQKLEPSLALLVDKNASKLIQANLVLDTESYEEQKKQIFDSIDRVSGMVKQNEVIIRLNQRLKQEDINKVNSLSLEYQARGERKSTLMQWLGFMGLLLYFLVVVYAFNTHYWLSTAREEHGFAGAVVLNAGLVVIMLAALLTNDVLGLPVSLIPLALAIIPAAVLLGFSVGYFYTVGAVLLLGPFINWDASGMTLLLLSTLITLVLINRFQARHNFIKIWLFLFLSVNLINGALTMISYTGGDFLEKLQGLFRNTGYSLVSTTISVIGSLALVTYFERKWNRATKQVLMELQEFNHPLLKRLATDAVGTYHHSLMVGNLAERAAAAIGANASLARVGSYFHDIGKSVNPEIFTENNEDSAEFYTKFTPEESAEIIRDHVKEGAVLAEKHRIPKEVVDIIWQHHGTSYIRYFLDAAQRQGKVEDLDAFRYPGPLPQSKEAALVMLADVVESTSKSKSAATDAEIAKLIDDTIQRLIRDGQFDEAPITIKDLAIAKEVMCPVLESVFRKRLEYPEEKQP